MFLVFKACASRYVAEGNSSLPMLIILRELLGEELKICITGALPVRTDKLGKSINYFILSHEFHSSQILMKWSQKV